MKEGWYFFLDGICNLTAELPTIAQKLLLVHTYLSYAAKYTGQEYEHLHFLRGLYESSLHPRLRKLRAGQRVVSFCPDLGSVSPEI